MIPPSRDKKWKRMNGHCREQKRIHIQAEALTAQLHAKLASSCRWPKNLAIEYSSAPFLPRQTDATYIDIASTISTSGWAFKVAYNQRILAISWPRNLFRFCRIQDVTSFSVCLKNSECNIPTVAYAHTILLRSWFENRFRPKDNPASAALTNNRFTTASPLSRQLVSYTARRPELTSLTLSPKVSITSNDNCACLAKLHNVFPNPCEEKVANPLPFFPTMCFATFWNRTGWRTPIYNIIPKDHVSQIYPCRWR